MQALVGIELSASHSLTQLTEILNVYRKNYKFLPFLNLMSVD